MREAIVDINYVNDSRGLLGIFENSEKLLTEIKRIFWIKVNKENQMRGEHAHRSTSQLMICINGKVLVQCFDQNNICKEYILEQSGKALLVPPMIWSTQKYINLSSTLLVLCDEIFEEKEYIRNKTKFLKDDLIK